MIEIPAFAFRQVERGPLQLAFIMSTAEVDRWAKVPTKMSRRPTSFQRPAIQAHVDEVREFFKDPTKANASPTALILGFEPESTPHVQLFKRSPDSASRGPRIDENTIGQSPVDCLVCIEFDPWDPTKFGSDLDAEIGALFEAVKHLYQLDPGGAPTSSQDDAERDTTHPDNAEVEVDDEAESEVENDDEAEEDDASSDGGGEDAPLEPPTATAEPSQVDEEAAFRAFFEQATPRQIAALCSERDYQHWPLRKKQLLRDLLKDDRKPGLIIDGQHRVKGTAERGDYPFLVSFMPYASWEELAFQFIVNNGSAKRVGEGLLISIVGDSLSELQLKAIEQRLYRAKIKVSLIKAVMRVQEQENPFKGMLQFNVPGERGFLEAPAMQRKVVRLWHGDRDRNGAGRFIKVRMKGLTPDSGRNDLSMRDLFIANCDGKNEKERLSDWQKEKWFRYFSSLWSAVSEHFTPRLWPRTQGDWPPSQSRAKSETDRERLKLMSVTMLGILQQALLVAWSTPKFVELKKRRVKSKGQAAPRKPRLQLNAISPEEFRSEIFELVQLLPTDFFTDLQTTGFDGSDTLRIDLRTQMLLLLEGQKEFAHIKQRHKFWTR